MAHPMKNIWFVSQYAGAPEIGMQYRQFLFCRELQKRGHRASIISSNFSHLFNNTPKKTKQTINGIYYHWVNSPRYKKSISIGRFWNMLIFALRILFLDDKNLGNPDLIVVSSPSMLPIVAALKWKKKFNCKIFFEVRDIWPLTLQELGGLSKYHPLVLFMRYFEKMAYKKSDLILSLLPNAKEHFEAGGMASHKFRYLPNGVETDQDNKNQIEEKLDLKLNAGDFVIGDSRPQEARSIVSASQNEYKHYPLVGCNSATWNNAIISQQAAVRIIKRQLEADGLQVNDFDIKLND